MSLSGEILPVQILLNHFQKSSSNIHYVHVLPWTHRESSVNIVSNCISLPTARNMTLLSITLRFQRTVHLISHEPYIVWRPLWPYGLSGLTSWCLLLYCRSTFWNTIYLGSNQSTSIILSCSTTAPPANPLVSVCVCPGCSWVMSKPYWR